MSPHSLAQKNIVLTGATGKIGRLTAIKLAQEGAHLILAGRNELELENIALECEKYDVMAFPFKMDASKIDSMSDLFEFALDQLGNVDIWINNASVKANGNFTKNSIETHEQVIKTNLMSFIYSAYILLPYFKEKNSGTIINNISLGKFVPKGYSAGVREELESFKNVHICDLLPSYLNGTPHVIYKPAAVSEAIIALCKNPKDKTLLGHSPAVSNVVSKVLASLVHSYLKGAESLMITQRAKNGWKSMIPFKKLIKS